MRRLTEQQVETYKRDGILFPVPMFEPAQVAEWLARLEAIEAKRAGRLPPSANAKPHLLIPWLWEIVHHPRVIDAVEHVLGPDILCWATSFIIKNAHDPHFVAWHQDATYWGLSEPKAVTVWLALTPSTPESGCVRMLRGTHTTSLPHRNTRDRANLLGRREEVLASIDEKQAVDVVLSPGEASMHDVLILHGSGANRSDHRRVGFSMRFIPSAVRHTGERRNSATLVRGRDHGHFDLEEAPEAEFDPRAVARHSKVLRSAMATIFATGERQTSDVRTVSGRSASDTSKDD